MENKFWWAFKIGLFLVTFFWFILTAYKLSTVVLYGIFVPFTDLPATFGLGFRIAASFIALVASIRFLRKRSFSSANASISIKLVILFEAIYWLLFLPSGLWGFQYSTILYSREFFILETGLPCTVAAIVIPIMLAILFFKLQTKKPPKEIIKWTLIAAVAYLLVFWFNYTAQWWSEIFISGLDFLIQSRLYTFEFALTVGGLLMIVLYTAIYAKESLMVDTIAKLDLRKAGAIITAFGIYFDLILLLWVLFPDAGNALTVWPTFAIAHNADLWMASLPIVGVPLIFYLKAHKN
jgi:hypothetical protein